ncbi:MAG: DUF4145 domain-containing protein [Saprospiraceae bacterium]
MSLSINCPHCHKYTELTRLIKATGASINGREIEFQISWYKSETKETWWIGKCNSCQNPVLVLNEGDKIFPYPQPIPTDSRVPTEIKKDMDEAKLCFLVGAFKASVVMSRRVIQATCIDKGASPKKLLHEQIKEITDIGLITQDLKNWANEVRQVGNSGAHPNLYSIEKKDAEDILELAEQFIYVIYVVPAIANESRIRRTT